jgi:hypothetical protein
MDEKINILAREYNTIVFKTDSQTEMLRVTPDGFYIRGVKVEQGPEEAKSVYKAILQMIMWDTLRR